MSEWKTIESATDDAVGIFWLEWADDIAHLNPPIEEYHAGRHPVHWRYHVGKKRRWGSNYKATYWKPLDAPPNQTQPTTDNQLHTVAGEMYEALRAVVDDNNSGKLLYDQTWSPLLNAMSKYEQLTGEQASGEE